MNNEEKPLSVLKPSGVSLNAQIEVSKPELINGVPVTRQVFKDVDNPTTAPGYQAGDVLIVSNLYWSAAQAVGQTQVLMAGVQGVVFTDEDNPRPCGCLGLEAKNF